MRVLLIFSFVLAFFLSAIPLFETLSFYRPEWVVVLMIYWSVYYPQHIGLFAAWLIGLMLDLVLMVPLGYHALGMVLITYIVHMVYRRFRHYVLWHQSLWVFVLVGVFGLFENWLGSFWGRQEDGYYLVRAGITALLWPILVLIMDQLRMRLHLQ